MAAVVTVNDVLDGHVGLDVECLDRIYLNGYVPNLQVGGQVVSFMTAHLGNPIPSPATPPSWKPYCAGWPPCGPTCATSTSGARHSRTSPSRLG